MTVTKLDKSIKNFLTKGGMGNVRDVLDAVRDDGKITESEAAALTKARDTLDKSANPAPSKLAREFFNQVVQDLVPPPNSFNWVNSGAGERWAPVGRVGDEQLREALHELTRNKHLSAWMDKHPEYVGFDKTDLAYVRRSSESGHTSYNVTVAGMDAVAAVLDQLLADPTPADKKTVEPLDLVLKKFRQDL